MRHRARGDSRAGARDLGMQEVRPLTGGVAFKAGLEQVYAALLWSRVASRVLLIVGAWTRRTPIASTPACVRYPGKTTSSQAPRLPFRRVEPTTSFEIRATRAAREGRHLRSPARPARRASRRRRAASRPARSGEPPLTTCDRLHRFVGRLSRKPRLSRCGAQHLLSRARDACRRHASCGGLPGRARRGDVLVDSMCASGHARHRSGHDSCRHSTWYHALELGICRMVGP